MNAPLSVSGLNEQIKNLLESTFMKVFVEGELSRVTYHNSGHVYFSLKDERSTIRCVMFRGNVQKLKFRLEEGLSVMIDGALSLYTPRGEYQINCFMVEPSGHGALALAYEQLKKELEAKGYFSAEHKKALPKMPKKIALVTSATGAALQDMLRVAEARWNMVTFFLYDVLVQGERAASDIAHAIRKADEEGYDLIVVGRGGGSIEDLWAFNERAVVDAVYAAHTPVVSCVGHEIDWVITDFVADLRAPTPSAAMQMVLPDSTEMLMVLDSYGEQFERVLNEKLLRLKEQLSSLQERYQQHSIEQRLQNALQEIASLKERYNSALMLTLNAKKYRLKPLYEQGIQLIQNIVQQKAARLHALQESYRLNDPKKKIKKGYVQLLKNSHAVLLQDVAINDTIELIDAELRVEAKVLAKEEIIV